MSSYISYSTLCYKYYYEVHLNLILYQNAVLILIHHYNIMIMIITNIVCHRATELHSTHDSHIISYTSLNHINRT